MKLLLDRQEENITWFALKLRSAYYYMASILSYVYEILKTTNSN